jgi:hypothetical protein
MRLLPHLDIVERDILGGNGRQDEQEEQREQDCTLHLTQ